MTTAVASPAASASAVRLFSPDAPGRRARTLEDAVMAMLEERRLRGTAPCLVCGEQVGPAGACDHCGAELS